MTNQPPFKVTVAAADLTAGLTANATYRAQHVGGTPVQWCNYATDPTGEDVGWNLLFERGWIEFEAEAASPVWVRTAQQTANLTVNEAS